jgi:uncharacterized protein with FMN-binding domain
MPARSTGKKFALSASFIIVSIAYVVWQNSGGASADAATVPLTPKQTTPISITPVLTQPVSAGTPPTPTNTPSPVVQKSSGQYVDGSYTGSAANAYYGTVQVKAVVTNGQLADVQFVQHPDTHLNSIFINSRAMPLLTQEAIQAQSANVDGVSGATFTSQAFVQSLSSALALAKN